MSCKKTKKIYFAIQKWEYVSINPFHSLIEVYSNTNPLL